MKKTYIIEYRYKAEGEKKEIAKTCRTSGYINYLFNLIKIRITAPDFIKTHFL
jgi:hypothetical protein